MREAVRIGSFIGFAAFAILAVALASTQSAGAAIGAAVVYGLSYLGGR